MSDQQSHEQTATRPYSHTQQTSLNEARFINIEDLESTPSTKKGPPRSSSNTKSCMKRIRFQDQDDDSHWRELLTQSIKKQGLETPAQELQNQQQKKEVDRTQQAKTKSSGKYDKSCPICLCEYDATRGSLDCHHEFCFACIEKWCESATVCPCCRQEFTSILKMVREGTSGPIKKTERISVQKKLLIVQTEYDHYLCYQCGGGQDQHVLLICDDCDFYCCHVYCDEELQGVMPEGDWYCIYCKSRRRYRGRRRTDFFSLREIDLGDLGLSSGVSSRTRSNQLLGPVLRNRNPIPRNTGTLLRQVRRQVR